jgi:hypothetical protein
VANKLIPWVGKHVTFSGRTTLVKAVLTSVVIYFITVLEVPMEVLMKIDSIRRAYLWAACEKVTGGKCKVNWELVCKPKEYDGLGILNLSKFVSALRLRWLWNEWNDNPKPWVGLGTPCSTLDKDLFAAATTVNVGDGKRASFWEDAWLHGVRPRDVAPLIFGLSKKRKCSVSKALENDFWVSQINIQDGLRVDHIAQFNRLWEKVSLVTLHDNSPDTIVWNLSSNGCYSSKSAYLMQFRGLIFSRLPALIWRPWAPPKCKSFAWLVFQNRVWTADRLQRRGWPNCGLCKLCNQEQESAAHLLFKCRFTTRVWTSIKHWMGLLAMDINGWHNKENVKDWWTDGIHKKGSPMKAMASLAMLISWEIWKERNARIFRHHFSTADMVINKIKDEARLWCLAGAKVLCNIMPRE